MNKKRYIVPFVLHIKSNTVQLALLSSLLFKHSLLKMGLNVFFKPLLDQLGNNELQRKTCPLPHINDVSAKGLEKYLKV